jgi:aerobic carbon-monoxide dehydrogenase medium subunit
MIPAAFDYERVDSVEAAIAALQADDGAKLLAGGHSLLPQMKLRFAMPTKLVDIGRLRDLSYVREHDGGVAIGALTRYHDLEASDELRQLAPIVGSVAGQVGDPQVRHMGTIGGSVAHADPASDLPSVLLALGGRMVDCRVDSSSLPRACRP